jgi:hypothetical protein
MNFYLIWLGSMMNVQARQEQNMIPVQLMDCLREIVSQEPPWSEDDLAEWADEFLFLYEENSERKKQHMQHIQAIQEQERRLWEQVIPPLKRLVRPYQHDALLPALPQSPHGQLHGVGFIYDEDRDDRVLVAIDDLKDTPGLVALAEHEGGLEVYARKPTGLTTVSVGCDEWGVLSEFIPHQGRWKELTVDFTGK